MKVETRSERLSGCPHRKGSGTWELSLCHSPSQDQDTTAKLRATKWQIQSRPFEALRPQRSTRTEDEWKLPLPECWVNGNNFPMIVIIGIPLRGLWQGCCVPTHSVYSVLTLGDVIHVVYIVNDALQAKMPNLQNLPCGPYLWPEQHNLCSRIKLKPKM